MPAEFSTPPQGGIKIPKTVDIKDADPERQAEYAELGKVAAELKEKLPEDDDTPVAGNDDPPSAPPPEPDLDDSYYEPTLEDKQTFVRALLGGKQFEKRFKLFGSIDATFVDRTTEMTEALYSQLDADTSAKKIKTSTEEQWQTWVERYQLASTLREYKDGTGVRSHPPTNELFPRVQELMKMPKPLYIALMQTARRFEAIVNTLTRRAHDDPFWKTGGANSPLKRT